MIANGRSLVQVAAAASISFLLYSAVVEEVKADPPGAHYRHSQNTGIARAFCPPSMPVIGGGGFVETPSGGAFKEEKLRQTYPISDKTGTIAFGTSAIGWQVASSDFTDDVTAFSICASGG